MKAGRAVTLTENEINEMKVEISFWALHTYLKLLSEQIFTPLADADDKSLMYAEHLWEVVLLYAGVRFKTYSGLPFTYEIRKGRNGQYTKELWIDRREKSKSLAWSTVLLALGNIKEVGEVVERPKALGDIRGVTYIYGIFYRFGLIDVPEEVKEKKNDRGNKKQKKHQKI